MLRMSEGHVLPELNKQIIGMSVQQKRCLPLYQVPARLLHWTFVCLQLERQVRMLESSSSKVFLLGQPTDLSRSRNDALLAVSIGNSLNSSAAEDTETNSYSCLDARFYDDDILTVVFRDNSEVERKDRVLAQLPLSSLYSDEETEDGFPWDTSKRWVQSTEKRYAAQHTPEHSTSSFHIHVPCSCYFFLLGLFVCHAILYRAFV
ncbi:hypothetical protein XENTR_v10005029 [Xenopus tropicalis]|nr:hypothetical protein XENTR_v10005029 [Xenopus tropicalis]